MEVNTMQLLCTDGDISWVCRGKDVCIHLSDDAFVRRIARPHTAAYNLKSVSQEALDDAEMAAFEILAQSEKRAINDSQDVLDAFDFLWERT